MRKYFLLTVCVFICIGVQATVISGYVKNQFDQPLAFASVIIKGKNIGTTANAEGFYKIDLKPGKYTLVCEHIGYASSKTEIEVGAETKELNIILDLRNYDLNAD